MKEVYGCTREVAWHSAIISCDSYASLVLSNLPCASTTQRTDANHEPIVIIICVKIILSFSHANEASEAN